MPTPIYPLISAVRVQIRRNEIIATILLSLSGLSAFILVLLVSESYSRPLALCCVGASLAILWWVTKSQLPSLAVSPLRAAQLLDQKLHTKERVVSFVELASHSPASPQTALLESQLARLLPSSLSARSIAPYSMRESEKRSLIATAIFIAAALLLQALRPPSELEKIAASIEEIVKQSPDIPESVKREAERLISTMSDPTESADAIKTALQNTRRSLDAAKISHQSISSSISASPSDSTHKDHPAPGATSPSTTPTPLPNNQQKTVAPQKKRDQREQPRPPEQGNQDSQNQPSQSKDDQQQGNEQQGKQQDTSKSGSTSREGSSPEQSDSKERQGKDGSGDQQDSNQNSPQKGDSGKGSKQENSQQDSEQQQSGGTQGSGEGQGKGEGTSPNQSGNPSGTGHGDGENSNEQNDSRGGQSSGSQGKPGSQGKESGSSDSQSGPEKLEEALSKAESELNRSEQKESKDGQGSGNSGSESAQPKEAPQDGSQGASKPRDTSGKSEQGQGDKQGSQSSNGNSPEQGASKGAQRSSQRDTSQPADQSQQGGAKKSDTQSTDSQAQKEQGKGKGSDSKGSNSQGQETSSASSADQKERTNNPDKQGEREGTGGDSPQVDRNAKAREGAPEGPPGPGLGGKERFKEVQIQGANEKLDSRFTGDQSDLEANDAPAQPKTTIEDVILAKPKASSQKTEQQIPLEYRDVLK